MHQMVLSLIITAQGVFFNPWEEKKKIAASQYLQISDLTPRNDFSPLIVYCSCESMKHTELKRQRVISGGVTTDTPTQNCRCAPKGPTCKRVHKRLCTNVYTNMHTESGEGMSGFQGEGGCWCKQTAKNPGLFRHATHHE